MRSDDGSNGAGPVDDSVDIVSENQHYRRESTDFIGSEVIEVVDDGHQLTPGQVIRRSP